MEKIENIINDYRSQRKSYNSKDFTDVEPDDQAYYWRNECRRLMASIIKDLKQLDQSLPKPVEVPECVDAFLRCGNKAQKLACLVSCKYSILTCDMAEGELKQWLREVSMDYLLSLANGYTTVKKPKKHVLKLDNEYYDDVVSGFKKFEIRFNDRDYKVGDILVLEEYDGIDYTGDRCKRIVTYITDYAQQDGYVVLGIEPVKEEEK